MKKSAIGGVLGFTIGISLISTAVAGGSSKYSVSYPEGYRDWTHVKSMVMQKGHPLYESFGGIHHVYANEKALRAMKSNDPKSECFNCHESQKSKDYVFSDYRK